MEVRARMLAPLVVAVLVATAHAAPVEEGRAARLAAEAVALCRHADRLAPDAQHDALERGLALAERAIAADERSARGHFAVFCTLGKLTELDGIGWRTLGAVRRVRREADRALELAPDDVDALVGKAVMLLRLPRLLGGDEAEAKRCLERALELAPWHAVARLHLARLRGEPVDETLLSARDGR